MLDNVLVATRDVVSSVSRSLSLYTSACFFFHRHVLFSLQRQSHTPSLHSRSLSFELCFLFPLCLSLLSMVFQFVLPCLSGRDLPPRHFPSALSLSLFRRPLSPIRLYLPVFSHFSVSSRSLVSSLLSQPPALSVSLLTGAAATSTGLPSSKSARSILATLFSSSVVNGKAPSNFPERVTVRVRRRLRVSGCLQCLSLSRDLGCLSSLWLCWLFRGVFGCVLWCCRWPWLFFLERASNALGQGRALFFQSWQAASAVFAPRLGRAPEVCCCELSPVHPFFLSSCLFSLPTIGFR